MTMLPLRTPLEARQPAAHPVLARPSGPLARVSPLLARQIDVDDFLGIVDAERVLAEVAVRAARGAGGPRIVTAAGAVSRLGLDVVREVVLGAALREQFDGLEDAGVDPASTWRHLFATAELARAAAAPVDRDEAFAAGLLHDLGRLALAARDPGRYAQAVGRMVAGADPHDAERAAFGTDHGAWGERLAVDWRFPAAITAAIADHHDGAAGGLAAVVRRARRLAAGLGYGDALPAPAPDLAPLRPRDLMVVGVAGGSGALERRVAWLEAATAPGVAAATRPLR